MANFWFKRIKGDIERINEVPTHWRDAVRDMIEQAKDDEAKG